MARAGALIGGGVQPTQAKRVARARGFTLIELLVAMAVVAILAAIAIPSYSAYVTRGQRAAAKAALTQAAQFLERNYTANGCYDQTTPAACQARGGAAIVLPVTSAPNEGTPTYDVTVAFPVPAGSNAGQYFLLSAAPCGSSTNACTPVGNFTDTACGALLLDSTGQQAVDPTGTGSGAAQISPSLLSTCWQR